MLNRNRYQARPRKTYSATTRAAGCVGCVVILASMVASLAIPVLIVALLLKLLGVI
jgi:hypothetical protein